MISRKPVFVVFEGLDGSGKSTCARILSARLEAVLMTTPSAETRVFRDPLVASYSGCQEAGQLFYLSTVFAASESVRSALASGTSVVLDRYFLSTQAYAAFRGTRLELDPLEAFLQPATLTVFVDAPLEVRRSRLEQRGMSAADGETLSPQADACLRAEHRSRAGLRVVGRFLHVDTSRLSPEAIADAAIDALRCQGGLAETGGNGLLHVVH